MTYEPTVSACQGSQTRCALCHKGLKGVHSRPGQWKRELQQFLQQYSAIPLKSGMCLQG